MSDSLLGQEHVSLASVSIHFRNFRRKAREEPGINEVVNGQVYIYQH